MGWSAVLYSPYNSDTESIFGLNGTYRKRIDNGVAYEWGIDAADNVPIIGVGGLTGLTGDYNAKYTYCRKERNVVVCESNPSDAAVAAASLSNESLTIQADPPSDGQINCIRFYRTTAGGTSYLLDTDLNWVNGDYACTHDFEEDGEYISGVAYRFTTPDTENQTENTTTWEAYHTKYTVSDNLKRATSPADNIFFVNSVTYTDPAIDTNTADSSLGSAVATTHNRPPLGSFVAGPSFNGTLFIIKDNKLYFSLPKQPEYWPTSYYVDVSSIQFPGKCTVFYDKQPYFLTLNQIYFIFGTSASAWIPQNVGAKTGTQSQNGALAIEGYGIFHVGADGVYLFFPSGDSRAGSDTKITGAIDPVFHGETRNGVNAAGSLTNSWLVAWENKVYFGYPGQNETYPSNIIVFYLDEKRMGYYTRGEQIHAVAVDHTNNRLVAVDENGYVWEIEDRSITTDDGSQVSWEVESKAYTLSTRKHFPRWNKYDVDASDENCSATGKLILDGAVHQSHTLSDRRNTRRRLVDVGNGDRCSIRISGSGPVAIHMVESE